MRTDTHKDWTDALRESFPQEVRPADGGWEAVAGRMRRAAARRRAAIAAAVLALPLAGGLLFLPSRQATDSPDLVADTEVIQKTLDASPALTGDLTAQLDGRSEVALTEEEKTAIVKEEMMTMEEKGVLTTTEEEMTAMAGKDKQAMVIKNESVINDKGVPNMVKEGMMAMTDNGVPAMTEEDKQAIAEIGVPTKAKEEMTKEEMTAREQETAVEQGKSETNGKPEGSKESGKSRVEIVPNNGGDLLADADMPDWAEEKTTGRRPGRLSIGIGGSSAVGGISTSSVGTVRNIMTKAGDGVPDTPSAPTFKQDFVSDLPVSFGIALRYAINEKISVETGLDYSYLHSRFGQMHTKVHLVGIPLGVNYILYSAGPADFYAGGGLKAEKVFKARLGDLAVKEPELLWSGALHLGVQTPVSGKALLFLQPELSYYFTNTYLATYRTENRLGLTVKAGIRFDLHKH